MSKTLEYKDYNGSIEYSEEDGLLYGKVIGVRALISYEGMTIADLIEDFHNAIDDYLELCKDKGIQPEKAYKGTFNVRISPDLHRQAAIYALTHDMSLNSFVAEAVADEIQKKSAVG
ncbi:MAG: type II toxin-antitoxin system HicB family antitoxin [Clostridia bacterium]|nr:type II toxin-antitoxin system HicB family antitoxin [Clostridia bacterium]